MLDDLVPIALFLSLAYAVVSVTRIISDGRTRRRLIEAGASPELIQAVTAGPGQDTALFDTLKWALVIGAVGIALIAIQFLPYDSDEPIAVGLVLVFAAGGMLAYYAAARRLARGDERPGTGSACTRSPHLGGTL